jgi:hypothetical protein
MQINYQQDVAIDDIQQYLRRDCLEITGIPIVPDENTKDLVIELASAIGVDKDISITHRLPESRKVKDCVVKFTRRVKREEVYKKRSILKSKNYSCLPMVRSLNGTNTTIHINESLTAYRKRLLGKINQFKKDHKFKFLWTTNGKIHLREGNDSQVYTFTTYEQFQEFEESVSNR